METPTHHLLMCALMASHPTLTTPSPGAFIMLRTVGLLIFVLAAVSIDLPVFANSNEIPCLLIYSKNDDVRVSDKQLPYYGEGNTKRYQSQCVGLRIERGKVTVIVGTTSGSNAGSRVLSFRGPRRPLEPKDLAENGNNQAERPDSFALFKNVGQWLGRTDRVYMGSKGGGENVSEFLVGVFSGSLVIEPEGLRIPVSSGHLLDIASFRLFTGDALRAPIEGVDLSNHVISIRATGLKPGNSYRWTAQVMSDGRTEELSGRFAVASTVVTQAVREHLRARLGALDPSDPIYLLEAASVYSEDSLYGNASILTTQWYSEDPARPKNGK